MGGTIWSIKIAWIVEISKVRNVYTGTRPPLAGKRNCANCRID